MASLLKKNRNLFHQATMFAMKQTHLHGFPASMQHSEAPTRAGTLFAWFTGWRSICPPIIKKLIEAKWNTDNRHKRRLLSVVRKFKLCQSSFYPTASIWWKQQAPPFPLHCRGIQPSFTPQESCSNSSMVAGSTLVCNAITHDLCCFSATISNQPPSPVCR